MVQRHADCCRHFSHLAAFFARLDEKFDGANAMLFVLMAQNLGRNEACESSKPRIAVKNIVADDVFRLVQILERRTIEQLENLVGADHKESFEF